MELDLFALLVKDYDDAIRFLLEALRFDLIEDSSSMKDDCGLKAGWVFVPAWR